MKRQKPSLQEICEDSGHDECTGAGSNGERSAQPAILSAAEVASWLPFTALPAPAQRKTRLRQQLLDSGCSTPAQAGGRRWAMGCVSLEITQRCNLDCTLCYLSENAEAVRDLPIEEIFRRIDMIHAHYGPATDVQVSGGEPTLRKREELIAIVARIAELGMRPALFTNGIRATRALLSELADVGLCDVAFHVDITQQRAGYADEAALNVVRETYIERARGLPLMVIFNTTVCATNFAALASLARFFVRHADVVGFASFQLQAATGRGVLRERDQIISADTTITQIRLGTGADLDFDALAVGHPHCNRYALSLVVGDTVHDVNVNRTLTAKVLTHLGDTSFPRTDRRAARKAIAALLCRHPDLWWPTLKALAGFAWRARRDLVAARGRVHKLSFFVHNFMDAQHIERERAHACVFMVATAQGPLSMCVHNAKRDSFVFASLDLVTPRGVERWDPLRPPPGDSSGRTVAVFPLKWMRGRARAALAAYPRSTPKI